METKILEDLYLSKSSIELYLQCGQKYNWRYLDKTQGFQKREDQEASLFGNLIHEILEQKFGANEDLNVLKSFREKFVKSPIQSQKFYELGESLLTDYVNDSAPGKNSKILGLEIPFKLFLDNGVPIKGFIDRINELDEDTIEIEDYKTGFSQPLSPDALQSDIQVGIYNLAARILFPQYKKVKVTLNYLHFGKVSAWRDLENLESLKNYLGVIYEKIKNSIETGVDLEPRINSYCGYCEFKSKCSLYKDTVLKEGGEVETFNAMILPDSGITVDINRIDDFNKFIKNKIKLLEGISEKIKEFIGVQIKENGVDGRINLGKTNYALSSKKYINYDIYNIIEIAKNKNLNLNDLLSPKKGNIDLILKDDKISLGILKENSNISFGKEYVTEKK